MALGLVLSSTAEAADPDLLVWYTFDEGAGTTAYDSSNYGHHGVITGATWEPAGQLGGALDFDGAGDYVEDADAENYLNGLSALTVSMWIKSRQTNTDKGFIIGVPPAGQDRYITMRYDSTGSGGGGDDVLKMGVSTTASDGDGPQLESSAGLQTTEWQHVCMTWESGGLIYFYVNGGEDTPTDRNNENEVGTTAGCTTLFIGRGGKDENADQGWDGLIDDVRIYRRVLTLTEIQDVMLGKGTGEASNPDPPNHATDVSVETNLTWERGLYAIQDEVYFGTDPANFGLPVATISASLPAEYDPGDPDLIASTTYYWNIVETDGNSVKHTPDVPWSFTTVRGEDQVFYPANRAMIKGDTCDDNICVELKFTPGATTVKHVGYCSDDYSKVAGRDQDANLGPVPYPDYGYVYFAGNPHVPPLTDSLVRGTRYYWTVDATDAKGNTFPGSVWQFLIQPYYAFEPDPPNEAILVPTDVLLTWSPGYGVEDHDVYMGTNWEDVNNAVYNVPDQPPEFMDTVDDPNYQCSGLESLTKYYWRVDEVHGRFLPGGIPGTVYKGDVWCFETVPVFPITEPNLVGWWTFDVGVGTTTAFDRSGYKNDGTLIGDLERIPGVFDYALDFDGAGDYVNIDGYKGILGTNPFSISAWIKKTTDEDCSIVSWGTDSGRQRADFRLNNDNLRMEHGNGNVQGDIPLDDGEWHHVAVVVQENAAIQYPDVTLYVDGQNDTPTDTDDDRFNIVADLDVSIGRRATHNDRFFNGMIDDVRIYNYALSQAEIIAVATPLEAYNPRPADRALVDPIEFVECSWSPGKYAAQHDVYFGTNEADVTDANTTVQLGVYKGTQAIDANTYSTILDFDTTYYWRIDEVNGLDVWKGKVWNFRTIPIIPTTDDPNLIGWWKLDEGDDIYAIDWSGYDNHGILNGDPNWVAGYLGYPDGALEFNGSDQYVAITGFTEIHKEDQNSTDELSIRMWVKADNIDDEGMMWFTHEPPGGGVFGKIRCRVNNGNWQFRVGQGASGDNPTISSPATAGVWTHFAGIRKNNGALYLFINDELVDQTDFLVAGPPADISWIGCEEGDDNYFDGIIDDVQVRNVAGLLEAWLPDPADGALVEPKKFVKFSWEPGRYALTHELYFSSNRAHVINRNPAALVYDGADPCYPYPPSNPLLDLNTEYYWLVDEYAGLDSWEARSVWSFKTTECISLDNMEDYNDRSDMRGKGWPREGGVWTDGYHNVVWAGTYPYLQPVTDGSSGSNLNASTGASGVGSPYGATGPIHGGDQAMALYYDNDGYTCSPVPGEEHQAYNAPYYSEVEANTVENLGVGEDWAGQGIKALTLWYQGHPVADGVYYDYDANGWPYIAVKLKGRGRDIQGRHDEFYFFSMYPLKGAGSIEAQVLSMDNTDGWAKAGLMMREKMTPYSRYAAVFVTPGNGVTLQWREDEGGLTDYVTNPGLIAPIGLKLERVASGFRAFYDRGLGWEDVNDPPESETQAFVTFPMDPCTYVGTAVTSHNADAICQADFDDMLISPSPPGYVCGNIGLNDPEQMYVALKDGTGHVSVVNNLDDPNAAIQTTWKEWNIPLTDFNNPDLDFNSVRKIYVGFGDRDVPVEGGSGILYIDDIRACPPRCIPEYVKPDYDIALPYDCIVDEKDLMVIVDDWLLRDELITTVPPSAANLIARYQFENNFNDTGPYGYHATDPCGSGPGFAAGVIGSLALSLDGVDDHLVVEPNVGIDGNSPRTIAGWAKANVEPALITGWTPVFGFTSTPAPPALAGRSFDIQRRGGQDVYCIHVYGWERNIMPLDQDWHHLAGTYDGTTIAWYGDGARIGSADREINTEDSVQIGKRAHAGGGYWPGLVDEFRIYNYALSDAEIAYLATDGAATLHIPFTSDADLYQGELPGSQGINFKDYSKIAGSWLDKVLWP